MNADISTLFQSDFYRILDFKCRCVECITSKPEYVDTFSISFVRKGNFLFNVFRNSFDAHTGRVLLTKPGYEHTVTHTHDVPDECTIIEFEKGFYENISEHYRHHRLFNDPDIHSLQINTSADTEFLHYYLMTQLLSNRIDRLDIDLVVMEILEQTLNFVTSISQVMLSPRIKKNHLGTVERAKDYMMRHFAEDISLMDIAETCYVSLFHFSRIFKTFTGSPPHAFLLSLRLKNAEILLKVSSFPVTDIAFLSGFNSLEHFSATFTGRFGHPPVKYRTRMQGSAQYES
jgi:AraC family transcriptional regulator